MTTHDPHGDIHSHGLYADCERCLELAESPSQLDQSMRRRLAEGHIETVLDLEAAHRLGVDEVDA